MNWGNDGWTDRLFDWREEEMKGLLQLIMDDGQWRIRRGRNWLVENLTAWKLDYLKTRLLELSKKEGQYLICHLKAIQWVNIGYKKTLNLSPLDDGADCLKIPLKVDFERWEELNTWKYKDASLVIYQPLADWCSKIIEVAKMWRCESAKETKITSCWWNQQ